jgi:hypothetical protein
MAKKKAAAAAKKKGGDAAAEPKPKKEKKAAKQHKPPAEPFGDKLPNAATQGSPADRNWKPTGDAEQDISTLESQERYLYRVMVMAKAERGLAKAEAQVALAKAQECSVTDGFKVDEKTSLHKKADSAERRAAKADKEYKRAKDGYNAVQGMIHRYLTEPEPVLFTQGKKGKGSKAA